MTRMSSTSTSDIRAFSPFRTPQWRFEAAAKHVHAGTRPAAREDASIGEIWRFLIGSMPKRILLQILTALMRQQRPEFLRMNSLVRSP